MYFGLCNLPRTFQRIINSIFQELLHEGVLVNYMNDFIISAKTKKELDVIVHLDTNIFLFIIYFSWF